MNEQLMTIEEPAPRPFLVLMADDDADDVALVSDALADGDFLTEFRSVPDGAELLEYLHHRGSYADPVRTASRPGDFLYLDYFVRAAPTPDLILLDLNMPRRNGMEVLVELKETPSLRAIPIIVFSTSDAERDRYSSMFLGADRYITKPTDYDSLCDVTRMFKAFYTSLESHYGN